MSERAPSHERPAQAEQAPVHVERAAPAEYGEKQRDDRVAEARQAAAAESATTEPVASLPITDDRPYLIDHGVKMHRMRQNLSVVQGHLRPAERTFSRFVHKPLVSRVSNSAAKTVSRPSGLLGGGLTAFIGSLGYLISAYRLGFTYNFSVFLVFFIVGFIIGVTGEFVVHAVRHRALKRVH